MNFGHRFPVIALGLLLSAVAGVALAAQPFRLTDLGYTYGNTPVAVASVDGNAIVVGGGGWYWTQPTGVVSLAAALDNLPSSLTGAPGGSTYSSCSAAGINALGQIVGTYTYASGTNSYTNAYVYTMGGAVANIAFPTNKNPSGQLPNGFGYQVISDITNSGYICGWGEVGIDPTTHPYTYNVNTQVFTDMYLSSGAAGGVSVMATSINNNGWITGTGGAGPATAYVWNGTAWTDLGVPSSSYTHGSRGIAIDNNGDVVGVVGIASATKGDPMYVPCNGSSWGTMVDLGNLSSVAGYSAYNAGQANGVNDNGQIVGFTFNGTKSASTEAAFLSGTAAGSMAPLASLVANLGGWTLSDAIAISNSDDIIGYGLDSTGTQSVFLLTPLAGDANLDGQVDINDLTIVLAHYNQSGLTWGQGDFNGDGQVDINDLTIVLANYNQTQSAPATGGLSAVPEPGADRFLGGHRRIAGPRLAEAQVTFHRFWQHHSLLLNGKERHMSLRHCIVVIVGSLIIGAAGAAAAAAPYLLTDLGNLGGNNVSNVAGTASVNGSRVVVGTANSTAWYWENGTMTSLAGTLTTLAGSNGYSSSYATGVNASGQIVGYYEDTESLAHGFAVTVNSSGSIASAVNILPISGGYFQYLGNPSCNSVNSSGQVPAGCMQGISPVMLTMICYAGGTQSGTEDQFDRLHNRGRHQRQRLDNGT